MHPKNEGNHGFTCQHCKQKIAPAQGTARNHCPGCLWSLHIDKVLPGDRAATCRGLMRPAALFQKNSTWQVIHVCETCGQEKRNRLAPDDRFETVLKISTQT